MPVRTHREQSCEPCEVRVTQTLWTCGVYYRLTFAVDVPIVGVPSLLGVIWIRPDDKKPQLRVVVDQLAT